MKEVFSIFEIVLKELCFLRKLLHEKGRDNYKPNTSLDLTFRQPSPTKLKNGVDTLKSTSTLSDSAKLRNNSTHSMLRPAELALYDTKEIDFEEVNQINNDEDESEASWQKKSAPNSDESSGDSGGGFRKQVDFGIDKETSAKLEKLNVMLMVGKEKDTTENNNNKVDSAPTTSREPLDSPTRNYVKSVLGIRGLTRCFAFVLEPDF